MVKLGVVVEIILVHYGRTPPTRRKKRQGQMSELVCYCFQYSAADIEEDIRQHDGVSMIMARIMEEKKKGTCECNIKNPKGT